MKYRPSPSRSARDRITADGEMWPDYELILTDAEVLPLRFFRTLPVKREERLALPNAQP